MVTMAFADNRLLPAGLVEVGGFRMCAMATDARGGSGKTGSDEVIIGGFGFPERAGRITTCGQGDCRRDQLLPTDLYCVTHDRFLPLVASWANGARVAAVLVMAAVVYGCFALAAEVNSWLPLFLLYALIGLAVVGLPLRWFRVTAGATALIWAAACAIALAYHAFGDHSRVVTTTILLLAAGCGVGLEAGMMALGAVFTDEPADGGRDAPRAVQAAVTGTLTAAGTAGLLALSFIFVPKILSLRGSWSVVVAVVFLLVMLALGLMVAVVAGLVDGAVHVSTDTPRVPPWTGPGPRRWHAIRSVIVRRRVRTMWDRIGEVLRRSLIRLADAVRSVAVASARMIANILIAAVRIVVNSALAGVNLAVKFIVVLLRVIISGIASAFRTLVDATELAVAALTRTLIGGAFPVAALVTAAGLTLAAAGQTRTYLVSGSLMSLLLFGALAAAGLATLTATWITLATQHVSWSLRSARRSASITAPYVLLVVAAGGWVVGLPGTLGYGRIHVGWVTLVSTGILGLALVWTQFISKPPKEPARDTSVGRHAGRTE